MSHRVNDKSKSRLPSPHPHVRDTLSSRYTMAGKLTFLFALGAACLAAAVTGETELERLRAENARLKADANDGGRAARAVLETCVPAHFTSRSDVPS